MTRHTRILGHALGPAWVWVLAMAVWGWCGVMWWVG